MRRAILSSISPSFECRHLARQFALTAAAERAEGYARDAEAAADRALAEIAQREADGKPVPESAKRMAEIEKELQHNRAVRSARDAFVARSYVITSAMEHVPGFRAWVRNKRTEQDRYAIRSRHEEQQHVRLYGAQMNLEDARQLLSAAEADPKASKSELTKRRVKVRILTEKVERYTLQLYGTTAPPNSATQPEGKGGSGNAQPSGTSGHAEAQGHEIPRTDSRYEPLAGTGLWSALLFQEEKRRQLGDQSAAFKRLNGLLQEQIKSMAHEIVDNAAKYIKEVADSAESLINASHDPDLTESQRQEAADELEHRLATAVDAANTLYAAAVASDDPEDREKHLAALKAINRIIWLIEHPCEGPACSGLKQQCESKCSSHHCRCTLKLAPPEEKGAVQPEGSDPEAGHSPGKDPEGSGSKDEPDTGEKKDVKGGDGLSSSQLRQGDGPQVDVATPEAPAESPLEGGDSGEAETPLDGAAVAEKPAAVPGSTGQDTKAAGDRSQATKKAEAHQYFSDDDDVPDAVEPKTVQVDKPRFISVLGFPVLLPPRSFMMMVAQAAEAETPPLHARVTPVPEGEVTETIDSNTEKRTAAIDPGLLMALSDALRIQQAEVVDDVHNAMVNAVTREEARFEALSAIKRTKAAIEKLRIEQRHLWARILPGDASQRGEHGISKEDQARANYLGQSLEVLNARLQLAEQTYHDSLIAEGAEATWLRKGVMRDLKHELEQVERLDVNQWAKRMATKSKGDVLTAWTREVMRLNWTTRFAAHSNVVVHAISEAERDISGPSGMLRDLLTPKGGRDSPVFKHAEAAVKMLDAFLPRYSTVPGAVPDFDRDSLARIRQAYDSWGDQIPILKQSTESIKAQLGARERLAGRCFRVAKVTGYAAGILSGGGLVAVAKEIGFGLLVDAGVQGVRMAIDPRQSWSWRELVESGLAAPAANRVLAMTGLSRVKSSPARVSSELSEAPVVSVSPGTGVRAGDASTVEVADEALSLARRRPVALDTTAHSSAFPPPSSVEDPRFMEYVRQVLRGRDVRLPEAMLEEIGKKRGISPKDVLEQMRSLGGSAETLPEASQGTLETIERVAAKKVRGFDSRIAASAAELGEEFATGDFKQARAVLRSTLLTREQIISLRPRGIVPGQGWDPSMLQVLIALGVVEAAAGAPQDEVRSVETPSSY